MQIAFEIPLKVLGEFFPYEDFHFGLAHITDVGYIRAYQGAFIDNGMYENHDKPLSVLRLVEAVYVFQPLIIAAPDWMGECKKTLKDTEALVRELSKRNMPTRICGCVQGHTYAERRTCFYELQQLGCSPISFPFRTPRNVTIGRLHQEGALAPRGWYHLFGLQHLDDLKLDKFYPGYWTIDTGKPFKDVWLNETTTLRGHGKVSFDRSFSSSDLLKAMSNIAWLRRFM